jgi:hypothetical protein
MPEGPPRLGVVLHLPRLRVDLPLATVNAFLRLSLNLIFQVKWGSRVQRKISTVWASITRYHAGQPMEQVGAIADAAMPSNEMTSTMRLDMRTNHR